MASSILNSDDGVISGTSGLKSTGGDDGNLVFQSKGTETARINTDKQIVAAAGTASLPIYSTTGDTNTGIFFPAADTIAFAEGGAEAMRIDASGNLGLGVTPVATWSGYKVLQAGIASFAGGSSGAYLLQDNCFTDNAGSTWKYINSSYAPSQYFAASGAHVWRTAPSGTAGDTISFTQAMTLDASGNLGIVTTSPASYNAAARQLVVGTTSGNNGITVAAGSDSQGSLFFADGTGSGAQQAEGYLAYVHSTDAMLFGTGNTERARIDSSGNLLVGTTTATARVSITGSASTSAMINVVNQSAPSIAASAGIGTTQAASATDIALAIQFGNGSIVTNNSLFIRTNGNVENTNNSYGAFSDIKLKQDIVDAGSQWDDIKGLRVRKYRFKSDPNAPLQIGLVAQEVEDVSAGLVGESPDYEQVTRTREVEKTRVVTEAVMDEDGNEIEPAVTETYTEEEEYTESVALDTTTKLVKYSVLYMKAVKALQEAIERIETLEAKVSALEGN
jgi:hypothetical protein